MLAHIFFGYRQKVITPNINVCLILVLNVEPTNAWRREMAMHAAFIDTWSST